MRRLVLDLTEAEFNALHGCVVEETSGAMTDPVILSLLGKIVSQGLISQYPDAPKVEESK